MELGAVTALAATATVTSLAVMAMVMAMGETGTAALLKSSPQA
jgi:hypothetical protein